MNVFKETLLFSAERPNQNNVERNTLMRTMLDELNINYKLVNGVYEGTNELTFVVTPKNDVEKQTLVDIALKQFSQDCVLELDSNRTARLLFNGESKTIGKFVSCNRNEALKRDSYTYCPVNNSYYIVKEL